MTTACRVVAVEGPFNIVLFAWKKMIQIHKVLLVLLLFLCTASCATGYKKYGLTGGYKNEKIAENTFRVEYQGNGSTSKALVKHYWNMRANELCPNGYTQVTTNASLHKSHVPTSGFVFSSTHPKYLGVIQCDDSPPNE